MSRARTLHIKSRTNSFPPLLSTVQLTLAYILTSTVAAV